MANLSSRFKWLTITRIASAVVSLLAVLILPNLLGTESYSRYIYYLSLIMIPFQFTGFGIEQALQRYIMKYRSQKKEHLVKDIIWFTAKFEAVSFLAIIAVYVVLYILNPHMTDSSIAFLITILLIVFVKMIALVAYQIELGFERFKLCVLLSAPTELLCLVATIIAFAKFGFDRLLLGLLIAYSITMIIGFIIMWRNLVRRGIPDKRGKEKIDKLALFKFGLPMYLGGNITKLSPNFAIIALSFFAGKTNPAIGLFGIAVSAVAVICWFVRTIITTFFTELIKAKDNGDMDYFSVLINKIIKYAFIFVIIGYFAFLYLGRLLFSIVLPDYMGVMDFVPVVGLTLMIMAITEPYEEITRTHHLTGILLEKAIIFLILYILLYPWFIFKFAGWGAVISYTLIIFLTSLYSVYRIYKKSGVHIQLDNILKITAISSILIIPLFFKLQILIFFITALLWLALLYMFSLISRKDLERRSSA